MSRAIQNIFLRAKAPVNSRHSKRFALTQGVHLLASVLEYASP